VRSAQLPDEQVGADFAAQVAPYRRELLAHCYRMLGSVQDAEDLLQETLLRAWRGFGDFEGRSSLRTWLYRIATRACLNELAHGHRRVMPSGLGAPQTGPDGMGDEAAPEVAWLQPIPDALIDPAHGDPATITERSSSTRLALIAAMQLLPARPRAVLILRDVLGWRAAEVAELLETTVDAVNSSLLRSRAHVTRLAPAEDLVEEEPAPDGSRVLDRYVAAFREADVAALVSLLRDDVQLEMPPRPAWFAGRGAVEAFLGSHLGAPDTWRMLPVRANGQRAAAAYRRDEQGVLRAHSIHLVSVRDGGIARIMVFLGGAQFAGFGLPPTLPDAPPDQATPA